MTPEDLDFLRTDAGRDLIALAAGLDWSRARVVSSTATVRRAAAEHAAAAIDLVTARARAHGRIRGAERMLLTDEAVQQATAWPVAALRAGRGLTRVALEAAPDRQSAPAEKKGLPAEPAPAVGRFGARTRRRARR